VEQKQKMVVGHFRESTMHKDVALENMHTSSLCERDMLIVKWKILRFLQKIKQYFAIGQCYLVWQHTN
jgi:hypothetical protein